jgi:hypothetical protein
MEKIYKIKKSYILHSDLLPNATPLVTRFLAKMSKKRQRRAVVNPENNFSILAKFTDLYCNCKQQLSQNGK